MWSVLEKLYMPSTTNDEYTHIVDDMPCSKCAQKILGKIL